MQVEIYSNECENMVQSSMGSRVIHSYVIYSSVSCSSYLKVLLIIHPYFLPIFSLEFSTSWVPQFASANPESTANVGSV